MGCWSTYTHPRQQAVHHRHITVAVEHVAGALQHDGRRHVDGEEWWGAQEVVVEAHHVRVTVEAVPEPRQVPGQREHCAHARSVQ